MLDILRTHTLAIYLCELLFFIGLFLYWETRRPFVARSSDNTGDRVVAHSLLLAVNQPIGIGASWLIATFIAGAGEGNEFNLFSTLGLSGFAAFGIGFLLIDLSEYVRHRIMHSGWFWRSHRIHHSDQELDWSTQFRFHPVEVLVTLLLRTVVILAFGISPDSTLVYGMIVLPLGLLHHANVKLPDMVERVASKVIVTPAVHRLHHADTPECYDRNFAVVFLFWDRLFGTFKAPNDEREFGLRGELAQDNEFTTLLLSPFRTGK